MTRPIFPPLPDGIQSEINHWLTFAWGWATQSKMQDMASFVLAEKPVLCVEIGVFGGRSLFPVAAALRHNGVGKIVGIDPYTNDAVKEGGQATGAHEWWGTADLMGCYHRTAGEIERAGLFPWVEMRLQTSHEAVRTLADGSIDMLHIDGNHSEVCATRDVVEYLPKLRSGGIIVLDDIEWEWVKPAYRLAQESCDLLYEDETNGPGTSSWAVLRKK